MAHGQKAFLANLTTIDHQDLFFRALFVKVRKTRPLLKLHDRAKKIFEIQNIPPYFPHLSLMYGNFSQETKDKIIDEIGTNFTTQFKITSIHLFKTEDGVNSWYKVREFLF